MATLKEVVLHEMGCIKEVVDAYPTPNKTEYFEPSVRIQSAREALSNLSVHDCGQYCTDHNECAKYWKKVDRGILEAVPIGETTYMLKNQWIKWRWIDMLYIYLYLEMEDEAHYESEA